jgi:arabinofuranan 3-O-arabinosyltransferase
LLVDGVLTGSVVLGDSSPSSGDLTTTRGVLAAPVTGTSFELRFDGVDRRLTIDWGSGVPVALPISIAEVGLEGLRTATLAATIDTGCRDDLVRIDGKGVAVQVTGAVDAALRGEALSIATCDDPRLLGAGEHQFTTAQGRNTGLDIDQLVWRSEGRDAVGGTSVGPILPIDLRSPQLRVLDNDGSTVKIDVTDAIPGDPFWVVFGSSFNSGWTLNGATSDGPHLVDGYANGWIVTPTEASFSATLRFVPQDRVDVGFRVSIMSALIAMLLLLRRPGVLRVAPLPDQEPIRRLRVSTYEGVLPSRRDAQFVGLGTGIVAALIATPIVGLIVGLVAAVATRREQWRPLLTIGPSVLMIGSGLYIMSVQFRNEIGPGLHWPADMGRVHPVGLLAILLLAADLLIDRLWSRRRFD